MAGADLLISAWYARNAKNGLAIISKWRTISLMFVVLLGLGAIAGWWRLNLATVEEHLTWCWAASGM